MKSRIIAFVFWAITCLLSTYAPLIIAEENLYQFTGADISFLQQFSIAKLPPPPPAASNQYADNLAAANLGKRWFFDSGLSANRKVACASCHQPQQYFSDGLTLGKGIAEVERNTPSLLGAAYGPWKYWDGRKDSLWAQALEPLQDSREHGLSRASIANVIRTNYLSEYESVFGKFPQSLNQDTHTRILVNLGKAIMAYQRQLVIPSAPLDDFIQALEQGRSTGELQKILTPEQVRGLRLFVGKAACVSCHNGPLLTNFEFHNVGVPEANRQSVDLGRYIGIETLRQDEFTCLSAWSDAQPDSCLEMRYLKKQGQELVGAFKTPSLRNVAMTAPYMHAGQFPTLETVISHYNKPTPPEYIRDQHPFRPHFDIVPLNLSSEEQQQLVAFLRSLTSPLPKQDPWWQQP